MILTCCCIMAISSNSSSVTRDILRPPPPYWLPRGGRPRTEENSDVVDIVARDTLL